MNETSAGIIVLYQEHKEISYLVLHYEEGHWDFPKGHVENNENLQETALRETKEETNLDVKLKPEFKESMSYFFRRDKLLINKTVHFFLGESKSKKVKLSFEHIGFRWLPYEKALEILTYDNAKEILKKAHKYLTQKTLSDF